jgi:hypothetical protein
VSLCQTKFSPKRSLTLIMAGVDIDAATEAGVIVARIPGVASGNAPSCAEMAIYLILALLRNQVSLCESDSAGSWCCRSVFGHYQYSTGLLKAMWDAQHFTTCFRSSNLVGFEPQEIVGRLMRMSATAQIERLYAQASSAELDVIIASS